MSPPVNAQQKLAGKLTVILWGVPSDIDSIRASIDEFQKLNPGVTVESTPGDCGPSYPACKTLIAGSSMPDVIVGGIWNYNAMINDGVLTSLEDYIAKDKLNSADFTPVAWNAMKSLKDSKIYGLPMGLNIQSLYYNKTMFDKAGLAYPPADGNYTWQNVREWAKKLTLDKNNNDATSPNFKADEIAQWGVYLRHLEPIMQAFGGSHMKLPERKQCNLENPDTIRAMQFYQDILYKDHSAVTPRDEQEEEGYLRWIKGTVAMQIGSHEQSSIRNDRNPTLDYDIAPLPKEKAGNATFTQFHIWEIYSGSQNKDLAWQFVKYMATDGAVGPKGSLMGLVPTYKDLALGKGFLGAPNEPKHLKEGQLDPLKWPLASYPSFFNDKTDAIMGQDGMGPALNDLRTNAKPAAEAVAGVCAKVDAIMAGQ